LKYLTFNGAAKAVGINDLTLKREIAAGRLSAAKTDVVVLIAESELVRWSDIRLPEIRARHQRQIAARAAKGATNDNRK